MPFYFCWQLQWGTASSFQGTQTALEGFRALEETSPGCPASVWRSSKRCVCAQLCPTLCDHTDWSLPGSAAHGIFPGRNTEWVAIFFSRGSTWPRNRTCVSCTAGRFFTVEPPGKPKVQRALFLRHHCHGSPGQPQLTTSCRDSPEKQLFLGDRLQGEWSFWPLVSSQTWNDHDREPLRVSRFLTDRTHFFKVLLKCNWQTMGDIFNKLYVGSLELLIWTLKNSFLFSSKLVKQDFWLFERTILP